MSSTTPPPASWAQRSALLRSPVRKLLWIGAGSVALFIACIFSVYAMLPKAESHTNTIGLDFIAFYTAGAFVHDGRAREFYDLHQVKQFQHKLAADHGVDLKDAVGPWWNPPFYALVFVPFAQLDYLDALHLWMILNIGCALLSLAILARVLVRAAPDKSFKTWGLLFAFTLLSMPFMQAMSHAQNTCTSLLLMTMIVIAWRRERALLAGLLVGLMAYKPQLAAVVGCVMMITLGWRVLLGAMVSGATLLGITLLTLPGTLEDYRVRLPQNLNYVMTQTPYLWDRHATLRALFRLAAQGPGIGADSPLVNILWKGSAAMLGIWLLRSAFTARRNAVRGGMMPGVRFDRIISATIATTPLLMPFYFDYDQLLLVIPATLLIAERLRDGADIFNDFASRWIFRIAPIWYVWMMINPDIADKTHINGTVILLIALSSLLIIRARKPRAQMIVAAELPEPELPLAA